MRAFLQATRFCDSGSAIVADAVRVLVDGIRNEIDIAVRLFEFVRDGVRYFFGPWGVRASVTLIERRGMCTNKSNLLVALLRAARIPAAYGMLRVNPREYFGNIAPDFLKPLAADRSLHVYAAAFLSGKWVRCDPSTDAEIAAKSSHYCRQTRLVDWDGRVDALDDLQPQHVYGDLGLHANIDDYLVRSPRYATPDTLRILNDYIHFIRTQPAFCSADAAIAAYASRRDRGAMRE